MYFVSWKKLKQPVGTHDYELILWGSAVEAYFGLAGDSTALTYCVTKTAGNCQPRHHPVSCVDSQRTGILHCFAYSLQDATVLLDAFSLYRHVWLMQLGQFSGHALPTQKYLRISAVGNYNQISVLIEEASC